MIESLPEWQLGWLAGIVDGEGCIRGVKAHRGFPTIRVQVGMTHERTVRTVAWLVGLGTLCHGGRTSTHKLIWRWDMASRPDIYVFLKKLQPYLLTKAEHAKVALEYLKRRIANVQFTIEDKKLISDLKELNKTGGD